CDLTEMVFERDDVLAAINHAYGEQRVDVDQVLENIVPDGSQLLEQAQAVARADRNDLLDSSSRSPIIKLVNLLLLEAVQQGASDVHVQPYEDKLVARLRVDGMLFDAFTLPSRVSEEVISRLKVMGRMDIAEKRLPQDGRASIRVGERTVDLRIASLPTSFGERVVVRFLDKNLRLFSLDELGMDPGTLFRFRMAIGIEHGIILVTGPTGSGKTTTLYATLAEMDTTQKNVLTLEDPVEYQLPGLSQTQINVKKGLTFASGLRSVLRQDPDVIMVGEIRDHETATMAIQAALTGHLVFSTLHTNDAASAVTRLLDLGIEPYLVASSLIAVLAQRLVRRVCQHCGEPVILSQMDLTRLGATPENIIDGRPRRGRGCDHCRHTGYRGRVGLYELMILNEPIRRLIAQRALAAQIEAEAIANGMLTLRHDGMAKIAAGITTVDEVVRVTARAAL
ncbi:MAG: Flp pilus assembly complex ATPase component TadA, partial [Chloroflexota bacterium]